MYLGDLRLTYYNGVGLYYNGVGLQVLEQFILKSREFYTL